VNLMPSANTENGSINLVGVSLNTPSVTAASAPTA
jgi:hypothetical protein